MASFKSQTFHPGDIVKLVRFGTQYRVLEQQIAKTRAGGKLYKCVDLKRERETIISAADLRLVSSAVPQAPRETLTAAQLRARIAGATRKAAKAISWAKFLKSEGLAYYVHSARHARTYSRQRNAYRRRLAALKLATRREELLATTNAQYPFADPDLRVELERVNASLAALGAR